MISSNPPPSLYFLRDPPPSTPSTHNDETHPPRSTYLFISWRTDIHAVTLQNDARVTAIALGVGLVGRTRGSESWVGVVGGSRGSESWVGESV